MLTNEDVSIGRDRIGSTPTIPELQPGEHVNSLMGEDGGPIRIVLGQTVQHDADEFHFNEQVIQRVAADKGKPAETVAAELSQTPKTFGVNEPRQVFDNQPDIYATVAEALRDRDAPQTRPLPAEARAEQDSAWKDNNPKDAFGTLKAGITSYLFAPVLTEMAVGMAAGAFKYGAHNYLAVAPRSSVYTDAAIRHILQFVGGEHWDTEAATTVHHITAAMNSLHVLRAAIINNNWIDDRPPPAPPTFMENANMRMRELAHNVPEPVARYLADGQRGPGRIL